MRDFVDNSLSLEGEGRVFDLIIDSRPAHSLSSILSPSGRGGMRS